MSENHNVVNFEPLLTCEEAAKFLSMARSTLYEYASRNDVPHIVVRQGKRKRTIRFQKRALAEWVQSQSVVVKTDVRQANST